MCLDTSDSLVAPSLSGLMVWTTSLQNIWLDGDHVADERTCWQDGDPPTHHRGRWRTDLIHRFRRSSSWFFLVLLYLISSSSPSSLGRFPREPRSALGTRSRTWLALALHSRKPRSTANGLSGARRWFKLIAHDTPRTLTSKTRAARANDRGSRQ